MNTTTTNTNSGTAFNLVSFDDNACTTLAHYLEFVRQWKTAYRILSRAIRHDKAETRAHISAYWRSDKKPSPKHAAILAAAEKQAPTKDELALIPSYWSYSALATAMLQARLDGKEWVKAQNFPWPPPKAE